VVDEVKITAALHTVTHTSISVHSAVYNTFIPIMFPIKCHVLASFSYVGRS